MGFQLEKVSSQKKDTAKFNRESYFRKEITLFGNSFSNKLKEDFYTEMSVLLKAGVSLKEALELIGKALKKQVHQNKINDIIDYIIAGESLSKALKKDKEFSDYEYFSIKIGEETGTLIQVTKQLSEFYIRKNEQYRNIISALTYPGIILSTAFLVVVFMLQYVVPMFQDIFEQQKVELPVITKIIIHISSFLKTNGWILVLLMLFLIILRVFLVRKIWFRKQRDYFILKLPFIGDFVKTVYLSRFTQAISLLTASKVPIINSIQLVKKMINFYPLKDAIELVEKNILKGMPLSESLNLHKLFDDKMIALVKVAEETNQNEFIFERLNTQYNTMVQQKSKLLSTIIEPIIILIIGVLVGVILIAMYLPMFRLSSIMV